MRSPLTTTLDQTLVQFLVREAKRQKVHRNAILEKALQLYRNALLAREIKEGLQDRQQEYRDMASDFLDTQQYVFRHL